jgi:predicted Zn-dependent protease
MPKYAAGVTNLGSYSGAFLERARIKIFTDYFKCAPSDSIIRSIAVHEIGHALGIDGHSGIPSDIMYFAPEYADPKNGSEIARAISERDVSTLRQMYEVTRPKTSQAPRG